MQARILNQSEERLWSEFVQNHPLGNIHQTPEWGHFQSKIPGRGKYWIVVIEEFTKILAGTLLVRHSLPRGYCWLYAPRGPLLNYAAPSSTGDQEVTFSQMSPLFEEIKKIAKKEKAIFLRVDPYTPASEKCARAHFLIERTAQESHSASDSPALTSPRFSSPSPSKAIQSPSLTPSSRTPLHFPHFRQNMTGFQPDHTLILDLTKSESEILAQMKPKGRYNIKLAEKKGVKIRQSNPEHPEFHSDLSKFYQILNETTSRDGFHGHNEEFYMNMLTSLTPHACLPSGRACLYLAEYEGQVIAGALNTFYKDTATYYYGASSNTYRNVMAPYLLHWHAIKEAKANGYKFYDFFGIAPSHALSTHPWAGVTEFKKKFGGTEVSYQKPQEFIFKKALYGLYRIYKNLRKK